MLPKRFNKLALDTILNNTQIVKWPDRYQNRDTGFFYKPHTNEEQLWVYEDNPHYAIIRGGEGSGKGNTLDTIIPTIDGQKTMADIKVGDFVFSENGIPIEVIAIYPTRQVDCYKITFDTKEEIVVDKDHLWVVETYSSRKKLSREHKGPNFKDAIVVDTKTLFENQRAYCNRTNFSIPLSKPLELPKKQLSIHPYILGSWLGGGTSNGPYLTIGEKDRSEVTNIYKHLGYSLTSLQDPFQFRINQNDNGDLKKKLRQSNLLENKHIPMSYLRSSYSQRLALLQGLMDTDGHINKNGNCEFCTIKKEIAIGFQNLCFTLGIKTSIAESYITVDGKPYLRYCCHFNPNVCVFRLSRKLNRQNLAHTQQSRGQRRYLVNIEAVKAVPTKCITVDSPTQLYLCTSNLIPTHNSVALCIKVLERLRRGMSGIIISPNLPHFRRSLFPEFMRWLPKEVVVPQHQRFFSATYEPRQAFSIVVKNQLGGTSRLDCAGGEKPITLEGPNLSFAALDEIRGMPTDEILKVLSGRVRIVGPNGEPPQLFASSTPKMHWMFDWYGPPKDDDEPQIAQFKKNLRTVVLRTEDNIEHLNEDYVEVRGMTLNAREKEVRLKGEWQEEGEPQTFLDNISQWDRLKAPTITAVKRKNDRHADYSDKLVVALDGAVSRDYFAFVAVSRAPWNRKQTMVRYVKLWEPPKGQKINFGEIKKFIKQFCQDFNVLTIVYDPFQLHQMGSELMEERLAWTQEFNQNKPRTLADQMLYDNILTGDIFHDGNEKLREHINNADKKIDAAYGNKRRLAKRSEKRKIDAAVATGMANFECRRLNI